MEEAEAAPDDRLVVVTRAPGEAHARAEVVLVGVDELLAEADLIGDAGPPQGDQSRREQGGDLGVGDDVVAALERPEVREQLAVLVPDPDDLVAQAQEEGQVLVDPPVVLDEARHVLRVALERSPGGRLVGGVVREPEQEIGEGVPGLGAVEAVPAAEVDADAEAVARHVAVVQRSHPERVAAQDPGEVVTDREGVLPQRAVHVAPLVRDVAGTVRARGELEGGEAAALRPDAGRVLEPQLAGHVVRQERALPLRVVVVVAGPELIHHRGREDLGPAADGGGGVQRAVQDGHVGEGGARFEGDGLGIPMLIARAQEERVVLAGLVVDPQVGARTVLRLGDELLEHPVPVGQEGLVRERPEEAHDVPGRGVDAVGRDHLVGEGLARQGVPRVDHRALEVAVAHGRGGDGGPATPVDRLVVGAFVVDEEERLAALERSAQARAPAVLVGVGVRIAALHPGQLLVVGQRVQVVGVEVVERGAVVAVAAALRGDHHSGQAPVLGAVGVGEDLDLGYGVQPGGGVAHRPEDRVGRGLAVLDVGDAVGPAAQELDVVASAQHVRVQEQEGLDVAAAAGEVAELLLVEPPGDGLALQGDVAEGLRGDGDRLRHGAQLQLHVHERGAGRAEHHAGLLGLLEVGGGHLDAVGAGPQVRGLEAALGVGLHGARHARGLVDDEDGGAGDGRPLGIHDRPADGPQEGLGGRVSRDAQGQEQGHKDPCSHLVLLRRGSCRSGWKSQENDSCLAFYTFSLAAVKLFLWAGA